MKEIHGHEQTIKQLIGKKYAVDSYQREYKWESTQLNDLINDLSVSFNDDYSEKHEPSDVARYGQYFLGPIIVSIDDQQQRNIVDGQQRLTTLTLMLICLSHMLDDNKQREALRSLIYSDDFGAQSFNLDVPERAECLQALFNNGEFDADGQPDSVRNMVARYKQLQENLSESASPKWASLFAYWLIGKVYLVEITTGTTSDAYQIFETMNDRGLRLTPAEMLKGFLLMEIRDGVARKRANAKWKKQIDSLSGLKNGDVDLIKSWLRGRHAETMSDFERIGSQFHRWVRDNSAKMELKAPADFERFIGRDFIFYAKQFLKLRQAADLHDMQSGLECVHYLAQHSFTLQYPLLLSVLVPELPDKEIRRRLRVVAAYLDILVHRHIGHWTSVAERSMRNSVFDLIPELRAKNADEIADFLAKKLEHEKSDTFAPDFALHGNNRPRIHRILARITDYLETESHMPSRYADYFASGKKAFQIEHVWHDNYAEVCAEESISAEDVGEQEFDTMRNYIGGLILLPSKDNASYGALPYGATKRDYYQTQNALAASLHDNFGKSKAGFRQFVEQSGLPFHSPTKFQKADIEKRQTLYRQLADRIWSPDRLHEAAKS
ncbi:MAG: DUF262 domain-containing protein [Gammaproteobacteria bacterium]|nr:DUF262 domain-containing protein [Gammaproteobacteria bacterium]